MLKTENLDYLFSLLEEMTQSKLKYPKLARPLIMQRFEKYSIPGYLFIALVLLGAWQHLGITPPSEFYVDESILIVQGLILVYGMTLAALTWWDGKQYFPAMLTALKNDLHHDEKFIRRLWKLDKETLAYGLVQYRHRWSFAEGRVAFIIGDLRKLGLFPAIVALLVAILLKDDSNAFVLILAIATAILYVMALYVLNSLERPKQVIQLLEYVIQHADKLPIPKPATRTCYKYKYILI